MEVKMGKEKWVLRKGEKFVGNGMEEKTS